MKYCTKVVSQDLVSGETRIFSMIYGVFRATSSDQLQRIHFQGKLGYFLARPRINSLQKKFFYHLIVYVFGNF